MAAELSNPLAAELNFLLCEGDFPAARAMIQQGSVNQEHLDECFLHLCGVGLAFDFYEPGEVPVANFLALHGANVVGNPDHEGRHMSTLRCAIGTNKVELVQWLLRCLEPNQVTRVSWAGTPIEVCINDSLHFTQTFHDGHLIIRQMTRLVVNRLQELLENNLISNKTFQDQLSGALMECCKVSCYDAFVNHVCEVAQELIDRGGLDVNRLATTARVPEPRSFLVSACSDMEHQGDRPMIPFLLEHGADVNLAIGERGETPFTALWGSFRCEFPMREPGIDWFAKKCGYIRMLLQHGADVNVTFTGNQGLPVPHQTWNGVPALFQLLCQPQSRRRDFLALILLQHGKNIQLFHEQGWRALQETAKITDVDLPLDFLYKRAYRIRTCTSKPLNLLHLLGLNRWRFEFFASFLLRNEPNTLQEQSY